MVEPLTRIVTCVMRLEVCDAKPGINTKDKPINDAVTMRLCTHIKKDVNKNLSEHNESLRLLDERPDMGPGDGSGHFFPGSF